VLLLNYKCTGVMACQSPCHARSRTYRTYGGFARNGCGICRLFPRALPNQPRMSRGAGDHFPSMSVHFRIQQGESSARAERAHAVPNPPQIPNPKGKSAELSTPFQASWPFAPCPLAHFGSSDLRLSRTTLHCPIRCEQCVIVRRWILRGLRRGPNAGYGVGNATCNMRTEWTN
jgi:hypothetical protein